jgi:hypothetical protein
MAYDKTYPLDEFIYEYKNDTGMNDEAKKWMTTSKMILSHMPK